MRFTITSPTGPIAADVIEQTVDGEPGYKVTIPGYNAVALIGRLRAGGGFLGTFVSPGHADRRHALQVREGDTGTVREWGADMLVSYIEENAIPLRTGQLPTSTAPVDRDAKWRTPPTHRRAGKYRDKWRKNHRGPLGAVLDALMDTFLD